jgi:hypothetical protein
MCVHLSKKIFSFVKKVGVLDDSSVGMTDAPDASDKKGPGGGQSVNKAYNVGENSLNIRRDHMEIENVVGNNGFSKFVNNNATSHKL